jgi:UTP--glucose-1-phosphate uridylyltransferase
MLTQAVLPVAGFGTRFLPWTKVVPKELLPIGNKPIIALLVDECLSVGIKEICFVISEGKEAIPRFFETDEKLEAELSRRGKLHLLEELSRYHEVKFHTVYQKEMKGDGDAIVQAQDWITSDAIAVLFGDDLIAGKENGLTQLVCAYQSLKDSKNPALLCLHDVPKEFVSKYGIVDIAEKNDDRLKKIVGLVEKPSPDKAPSTLGIVGKYIIPHTVLDALQRIEEGSHGGEVRLIDALIRLKDTIDIFGYVFEGTRLDTGTPEGYKEAVQRLG